MWPIQGLALSHGCASPCREPLLIGNLPSGLFPRASARIAPSRGLHVLWPVPWEVSPFDLKTLDVERSSRLDFLVLHNIRRRFIA